MATAITAYFCGKPRDTMDVAVHSIFEAFSGEFVGCGTFLPTSERDVEYDVPDHLAEACKSALRRAGYRLQSHADTDITEGIMEL